ncbi:MAG: tetratricopeptide repeat protein [Bacteriovoracaceae bacterium]
MTCFFFSCDFTSSLYKDIIKAQDLMSHGKYEEAVAKYEEILRHNPSPQIKVKIYFQLGEIYSLYLNDGYKAMNYYEKVSSTTNDRTWQIKVLEKEAEITFTMLKDYKSSSRIYRELYEIQPKLDNQDFFYFRLGVSLRKNNENTESIKIFSEILKNPLHPYYLQTYYELGLCYYFEQKWSQAIAEWMEYLKYEKNKDRIVETKFMIANSYETKEDLKEAYDIYYSILPDYPNRDVIKGRLKSLFTRRQASKR